MSVLVLSALAEEEAVIERGLASFVEVGNALMTIRDQELYREAGFDGFVEYLGSKPWGIGANAAYKQIQAAAVAGICTTVQTESQARELAPLLRKSTPEVVKQVYDEVVEETDGKPTARAVREKVQEVLQQAPTPPADRSTHAEIIEHVEAINRLSKRWEPDQTGRLSQSTCKRQNSKVEDAMIFLSRLSESFTPRLDSLPSVMKGARAPQ